MPRTTLLENRDCGHESEVKRGSRRLSQEEVDLRDLEDSHATMEIERKASLKSAQNGEVRRSSRLSQEEVDRSDLEDFHATMGIERQASLKSAHNGEDGGPRRRENDPGSCHPSQEMSSERRSKSRMSSSHENDPNMASQQRLSSASHRRSHRSEVDKGYPVKREKGNSSPDEEELSSERRSKSRMSSSHENDPNMASQPRLSSASHRRSTAVYDVNPSGSAALLPAHPNANRRRTAVSAEAFGLWNKPSGRASTSEAAPPKSADTRHWLSDALSHCMLFRDLDQTDLAEIVDGCRLLPIFARGEVVIQEGDDVTGTCPGVYVLEHGHLSAYKSGAGDSGSGDLVRTYRDRGDIVGELALLYNAPRAATIIATAESALWTVTRNTVVRVKRESAARRRKMFDTLLSGVDILKDLTCVERAQLVDALQVQKFEEGATIIHQGDPGDTFYLVIDGEAVAQKDGRTMMKYMRGSYFGELALLQDQARAASVKAVTDCSFASLDRESFQRLLGPLQSLRTRTSSAYGTPSVQAGNYYQADLQNSDDYLVWSFGKFGATVKKLRRCAPDGKAFQVGDRLLAINGVNVCLRSRDDIQAIMTEARDAGDIVGLDMERLQIS